MSVADEVVLVLMPGSGDSVQALKAGIMEIPDVIAINKMDQPGAKTMLNDIRGVIALDPDAERRPPIVLTEAVRGEGVDGLWDAHRRRRTGSRPPASSRSAGGGTSPARWSPPPRRGPRRDRAAIAEDPALAELVAVRAAPRDRPADRGRSHRSAVFGRRHVTAPCSRTSSPPASASRASRGDAGASSGTSAARGRVVTLKAENLQLTGSFKIRGAFNTIAQLTDAERDPASSRRAPATTVRRSRGRRARPGIAATIFVPEGRRWPRSTRLAGTAPPSCSAGEGFDDAVAAASAHVERDGRDIRPRVRRSARRGRPGDARARAGGAAARRARDGRDPDRRRGSRVGRRDRTARTAARAVA